MSSLATRLGLVAAIGMVATVAQAGTRGTLDFADTLSTKPAVLQLALQWECMTDDGYGRKLPCSMGYKTSNPNWKGSDACHTKDSKGKIIPCSDTMKAKFKK